MVMNFIAILMVVDNKWVKWASPRMKTTTTQNVKFLFLHENHIKTHSKKGSLKEKPVKNSLA
jgi:hypothetical protein